MPILELLARLLRLPPPTLRPWSNDVSVRRERRRERREAASRSAEERAAERASARPWWQRTPALVTGGVLLVAFVVLLAWVLPGAARASLIAAVQIALLRVTDVMLGVFRTTFIVRGRTMAAAGAAAGESAAWLTAAGIVLADLTIVRGAAFALGVGTGTALGMLVVRSLRLGMVTVRVFAPLERGAEVAERLRGAGQGATVFPGEGRDGPVAMVLSVMRRREADEACRPFVTDTGLYVTMDAGMGPSAPGRSSAK
jgi:uncharacterized protein YebE (UPF0316 family)